ncbi:T9SS type A sorting domain-containing protein [Flavobacterium sp. T12S277]|uniref:T9SS type A sorting domain-containing protein n=1 Tax=Flavobacterium sp. T12S277 TaxID=3402752 RepID=UPI003ADBFF83
MTLDQKGKILSGIWKEKEGDQAQFKAEITPDAIVFENSQIDRIEHFSNNIPKTYEFKQAKVQYLEKDNEVFIAGNIQLYDLKEHENEKPMYLSLQRNAPAADDQTQQILSQLIVYPNPVTSDSFNLSFELAEYTDISVDIYSFTGFLVNQQKLKTSDSGHQELAIPFNAPPGNYILNLKYGAKMIKTI